MSLLRPLGAAVVLLLLLAPTSLAQQPASTLTLAAQTPKGISTDETVLVPVTVSMGLTNIVCTSAASLKVTITSVAKVAAMAAMPGMNHTGNATFSAVASPSDLTFTVPQGAYGNNPGLPAAKPYAQAQTVTIAVKAHNLTHPDNVTVQVAGALPAYAGMECRGSAGIPAANGNVEFKVAYDATTIPTVPTTKVPLPSGLVVLGLVAAALVTRRVRRS
jgi:hypothetical protein